jgi:hypothetical protein
MGETQHRLRALRRFTVPKAEDEYTNEDFLAGSERKGIYALSDGASISFDSAAWARIVAIAYVRNPQVTTQWLTDAIEEFSRKYDRDALPWMAQAAFDRGSFASLLGIQLRGTDSIEVFAIGDSQALLCEGDAIISMFPYSVSTQFTNSPMLLSTSRAANVFLKEDGYPESRTVFWDAEGLGSPAVYCMTDALAQWVLERKEEGNSPVKLLQSLTTVRQFRSFVQAERASGRMKRDDTTLLVLS